MKTGRPSASRVIWIWFVKKTAPAGIILIPILLQVIIDGDWVKANETTLGADNGIGIAAQLAILADPQLKHGPLECLFTVDEETGLNGAKGLESGFFSGKILLNLDSEDEGELFIGCAGGMNTIATLKYKLRRTPAGSSAFRIEISGLAGWSFRY